MQNPTASYQDFPFSIKKMSASGCLVDFPKLSDISKNVLSHMTADQIYDQIVAWATEFESDLASHLTADPDYAKSILAIGRGGKKPRKDLAVFTDVKPYLDFFYDDWFEMKDSLPEGTDMAAVKATLEAFKASYDHADDMNVWFDKVKAIATELGFAADMKAYKADPTAFKGSVADISAYIRLAVTGRQNAPDLYTVMQLLGRDRTLARIDAMLASL